MALRLTEEEFMLIATRLRGPTMSDLKEPEAKQSKYRNKKMVVDGYTFDSMAEAKRYGELKLLEQAGKISHLARQTRFKCYVNRQPICIYIADFAYNENGIEVVEDVKGVATPVYKLKKKLVEALYNVKIKEVAYKR